MERFERECRGGSFIGDAIRGHDGVLLEDLSEARRLFRPLQGGGHAA